LRDAGHELTEINYAKTKLDEATVRDLVKRAGSVAAVLNTRNAAVKEKGWNESPPDVATFAKAVASDPNLIKRPIFVGAGNTFIVGFDKAAYAKLKK
jgi:arsenate reductase-like glutaredoxin family protein